MFMVSSGRLDHLMRGRESDSDVAAAVERFAEVAEADARSRRELLRSKEK